ncbi:MAG TPA: phage portal protein [Anaerolineales bacterium]|nr:phage portal protein [Anaerolineales bacterium]
MTNSPFIFASPNPYKSGFDFAPWGGIEGFLEASKTGQTGNVTSLKKFVPDLAHAVDMTAVAISSLPFDILDKNDDVFDTSANWKNNLGGLPNPQKLIYLIASSLCGGAAYLIPWRTTKMIVNLQYCAPGTIQPYIDINGLQWFDRTAQRGKTEKIYPNKIIYFWLPDSDVEIGPAENHPLGNATLDAQVIWNMKNTMRMYGERGFVPITLLGAKGMVNQGEREKAEGFFDRLLRGGFNVLAKIVNSDALSLIRVGAGMDELKQSYIELRRDAKESVSDSFGIPTALFMSDNAFASEFDALRKQWYTASRFVGIKQTIEETFTDQLFKPYGYRMRFNLEALEIFQEDEVKRNESLVSFVTAVTTDPEVADLGMSFMGYDLDKVQQGKMDRIIARKEEARLAVVEQMKPPVAEQSKPVETELEDMKAFKAGEYSAMIALRIPDLIKAEIQSKYTFADEELLKDLHITLVYLGDNRTIDKLDVIRAVSDLGMFQSPIKGRLQGLARFVSDGENDPVVMTFDSPQAPKLYNMLCGLLDNYHVPYHKDYGFIPHMTLAYIPKNSDLPVETIEPIEINFSEVYYVDGEVWFPVDLVGYENKSATASNAANLTADEIKDLALWYDRARQWYAKGKGTAVDWECKHLRETIAAPIRLKLADAKSEADIAAAFVIGETTSTPVPIYQSVPDNTEAIKALALTIERAIVAAKVEPTGTHGRDEMIINITNPANVDMTSKETIAAVKAMTENLAAMKQAVETPLPPPNVTFAPVIHPSEVAVSVTNEVQTPIVNVTNTVQPAPVENNITVEPSDVVIQKEERKPRKATVKRGADGKITEIESK